MICSSIVLQRKRLIGKNIVYLKYGIEGELCEYPGLPERQKGSPIVN